MCVHLSMLRYSFQMICKKKSLQQRFYVSGHTFWQMDPNIKEFDKCYPIYRVNDYDSEQFWSYFCILHEKNCVFFVAETLGLCSALSYFHEF